MNYWEVRQKFCEMSGRYDLIDVNLNDTGADFFLNAGQDLLDTMVQPMKGRGRYLERIAAGSYLVKTASRLRSVLEVWCTDHSDGTRWQLTKLTLSELRALYAEEISGLDQSAPEYCAPFAMRPIPDTLTVSGAANFLDKADLVLDDTHYGYHGIVVLPPADGYYTIAIDGLFYAPALSAAKNLGTGVWTQTKSWWTEQHPVALLYSALYTLENFYRNTEGAKDWLGALNTYILGLQHDEVHEESYDIDQMGG